jgi:2'-5' RNA ligase
MRLFTAIDIPEEIVRALDLLIAGLRPSARIKWSPASNLHVTTKFIGEWPETRLAELKDALAALPPRAPISIEVRDLGFFPNARAPRVFWAGVHAPAELADLARSTEGALARLGVSVESRSFSPHLTLARIKEPLPLGRLHDAIAALPSTHFGAFIATGFHLYQSTLTPSGSVYTRVAEFPFNRP